MADKEAAPFDLGRLQQYLESTVSGFQGPVALRRFAGGQSNPTFRLSAASGEYVLRKKPAGLLLPSAHAVDREYRVIAALHGTPVPVARPYCLCEDESVIGTPFYLMGFVEGRVLWDPSLPAMPPPERAAIYEEMNRVVAELHRVDYRAVGLADYGRPDRYVERQIVRWTKQYRASETENLPAMERLIEWLPDHIPPSDESAITHGDFRLDNMIFHPTEPRVLALLDWELSTIGHPLADFAYHAMVWRLDPKEFRGLAGHDLPALGIPDEEAYLRRYCERSGRPAVDPNDWDFYIAFNLFRLSAILQGILKRAQDGTAASEEAFENGRRAKPIAEAGWRQVERILARG
jgi:aminoglycoside phosphotransferase (APT) family kinase protein